MESCYALPMDCATLTVCPWHARFIILGGLFDTVLGWHTKFDENWFQIDGEHCDTLPVGFPSQMPCSIQCMILDIFPRTFPPGRFCWKLSRTLQASGKMS